MVRRATPRRRGRACGGTQTGASIALALGESATCTINNNDVAGAVDVGEDGDERQRRHRGADGLDVDTRPARRRSTGRRVARGDERAGECGTLRAVGVGWSGGLCRVGVVVCGRDADRARRSRWRWVSRRRARSTTTTSPAQLTLVKTVTNDNGGTALADGVDVDARPGRRRSTGATGAPTVTNAPVSAGSYALSETGGPAGYAASAWSCVGGTQTGRRSRWRWARARRARSTTTTSRRTLTLVKTGR